MKTPRFSSLTLFLAGTTAALLLVFGLQALIGNDKLPGSLAGVSQELIPAAFAGFGTNGLTDSMYDNYTSWPNSMTLKTDDTMAQILSNMYTSSTAPQFTLTDINGDGLTDFLLHKYASRYELGVFINNGNLGFTWAYKCLRASDGKYYGDCAAI